MTGDRDRGLPVPANLATQLEPFKRGGLIENFVGQPERSMDLMIQSHLNKVALLEARGDKVPERPIYIFNPDSRLLISYAMRHIEGDPDSESPRAGLFAEVVELDEGGKPRQGVSLVNPFETNTGFINVEVGDNPYGFTPSHIDLQIDSDDPSSMITPNIPIAELLVFQQNLQPIPSDETLEQFLGRVASTRAEQMSKMSESRAKRYPGTTQGLDESTNPYLHLIISDRDASGLAEISRSVGLFPIVRTVDEIVEAYRTIKKYKPLDSYDPFDPFSFGSGSWLGKVLDKQQGNTPGFITFDYPISSSLNLETGMPKTVPSLVNEIPGARPDRFVLIDNTVDSLTVSNAVFARLKSPRLNDIREDDLDSDFRKIYKISEEELEANIKDAQTVKKLKHGDYEQIINPNDPIGIQNYADWLRKVRLDMALTLYLRGISEL